MLDWNEEWTGDGLDWTESEYSDWILDCPQL